jgi:hypothetical protein
MAVACSRRGVAVPVRLTAGRFRRPTSRAEEIAPNPSFPRPANIRARYGHDQGPAWKRLTEPPKTLSIERCSPDSEGGCGKGPRTGPRRQPASWAGAGL